MIAGQFVAASRTELIGRAHGAEAITAIGAEPIIALWAKVKIALHVC